MAFCTNCGTRLGDQAAFCGNCGTRMQAVETPAANQAGEERAHMVLNVQRKEGILNLTTCCLVFFPTSTVFSVITKERQNRENKMVQERLKAEGKGFFKASAEMMSHWANFGQRYYSMSPGEILQEDTANTILSNQDINRITFVSSNRQQTVTGQTGNSSQGELNIECSQGKIKTTHQYSDSNKNIKNVLENLFTGRLKYKGGGVVIQIGGSKDGFR
ncbi:MAG: zinc ribbon domain-containing protein [Clostridia bacterium]